jgi:SAM-dependent methyltransferase
MIKEYASIFDERGQEYHEAMQDLPDVRNQEFASILEFVRPVRGETLCDVPSGGGYLLRCLRGAGIQVVAVETSKVFHEFCVSRARSEPEAPCRPVLCPVEELAIESDSVDAAMSLAGMHHIEEKRPVYRELHRILKPSGRLLIGNVRERSAVGRFLNEFVHENSRMGHVGLFLNDQTPLELETAGFQVVGSESKHFERRFPSAEGMALYCQRLFGIDRVSQREVLAGIENFLGFEADDSGCRLPWELRFVEAKSRS